MRAYSKIPKARLIAAVRKTDKQRKISDYYKPRKISVASMLDSPVPDLQEPVLQPTKAEVFRGENKHKLGKYKYDFTHRVEVGLNKVKFEIDS